MSMEQDQRRKRQCSEECDWENVSTPLYPLSISDVKYDAQNCRLEICVSTSKEHVQIEVPSLLLVPADTKDGDLSRCPASKSATEKLFCVFEGESVKNLNFTKRFCLVSKDDNELRSSDFSIAEFEGTLSLPSSKMIASVEDWDDGILVCPEEQQKLLDRMEEEVSVSRLSIQNLEQREEQLKCQVAELEGLKAESKKENEQLKAELHNALMKVEELSAEVTNKDATIAEKTTRLSDVEGQLEMALVNVGGLNTLVKEEQTRVRKLAEEKNALLQAQETSSVALEEMEKLTKGLSLVQEQKKILSLELEEASSAVDSLMVNRKDVDEKGENDRQFLGDDMESKSFAEKIAAFKDQFEVTLRDLQAAKSDIETLRKQLFEQQIQKEAVSKENEQLKAAVNFLTIQKDSRSDLEALIKAEKNEKESLQEANIILKQECLSLSTQLSTKNEDFSKSMELLKQEYTILSDQFKAAKSEIETMHKQLFEQRTQKEAAFKENEQLKAALNSLTVQKDLRSELEATLSAERKDKESLQESNVILKQECVSLSTLLNTQKEDFRKNIELLKQGCTTLSGQLKAEKEEKEKLRSEVKEQKLKLEEVVKRLVEGSAKSDGYLKKLNDISKKYEEEKKVNLSRNQMIADLTKQIEEKEDLLGRRIREVEAAESNLKRGLSFLPQVKHQVDTVVTTLFTEMESLKKLKENSETSRKALSCIKLCHQTLKRIKDELDEFQPNTEVKTTSSLNISLPRINDDTTEMSRDDLLLLISDLKARIREAYKDYNKVNEERKELRRQLNMSGQVNMPIIRKSEGDVKKWLKDVRDGGTDAIFAGTIECQTTSGGRQCILPTYFKNACSSGDFAIEDLGKGACTDCPSKNKDLEIWLKPSAKGANRGRSSFVDISSSLSYSHVQAPPTQQQQFVFDPDEDQEVFYDATYCEPAPKRVASKPVREEPKRLPCPHCSHVFEPYEQEEFRQHVELHTMFAEDASEPDPFYFGI